MFRVYLSRSRLTGQAGRQVPRFRFHLLTYLLTHSTAQESTLDSGIPLGRGFVLLQPANEMEALCREHSGRSVVFTRHGYFSAEGGSRVYVHIHTHMYAVRVHLPHQSTAYAWSFRFRFRFRSDKFSFNSALALFYSALCTCMYVCMYAP